MRNSDDYTTANQCSQSDLFPSGLMTLLYIQIGCVVSMLIGFGCLIGLVIAYLLK